MKAGRIKRIAAVALAAILTATGSFSMGYTVRADSCGGLEEEDIYDPGEDEVIKDPALHWAVRSCLNAIKDRPKLTADLVGSKQAQNISYALCAHAEDFAGWKKQYWIKSLEGLQYAKSAKMIEICYSNEGRKGENEIKDLSPLSNLSQLQKLILRQNNIDDISPLTGLAGLQELDVSGNYGISDVSVVANMPKLKILVLGNNVITDISAAAELQELQYLDIQGNNIESLPDMSKLKNMRTFIASGNHLTNEDVKKIAAMRGLNELSLQNNPSITDIKPLARLLYLEKEKTLLPSGTEGEKENLFAAIEVNKLFNKFNISKMQPSDSENVGAALDAYDALNDAQKAFFDPGRIAAARDNKKLVDEGFEAQYYEEYDEDGETQPVLDRIQITVVDKNGKPVPGITFRKMGLGEKDITTDKNGILEIKHTLNDSYWDHSITLKDTGYVAIPEKIEYEVKDGKTYIVNGKRVTGYEKHQIMIVPADEYVDKAQLKEALEEAEEAEEEYKYTAESYKAYTDALSIAQTVYDDGDASQDAINEAALNLKNAVQGLQKTDVLTTLKLIVKDINGNPFTRPFKFQIYTTGQEGKDPAAWNKLSDAETGVVYLEASPGWADGKQWTVDACYEEPYDVTLTDTVIGVKDNGQRYFKTVDGQNAGPDFEKTVIVKANDSTPPGIEIRTPDNTVLKQRLEAAKQYTADGYTEMSFTSLQTAIQNAEEAAEKEGATQEDYNAAAALLKKAVEGLAGQADTIALEKALDRYVGYTAELYVTSTWEKYDAAYQLAKEVYEETNSTQEQVDEALSKLVKAERALQLRGDKKALGNKLQEAKALKADDYISGYDNLQNAITEAQEVYDKTEALSSEIDEAMEKLQSALDALVKKPAEINYECYPMVFRAMVKDESQNPLPGVLFQVYIEGESKTETVRTDGNGVLEYHIDGSYHGKKTTVKLADPRYTTTDEHWFITKGASSLIFSITTINGKDYQDGTKLTYTLKPQQTEETPQQPQQPAVQEIKVQKINISGNSKKIAAGKKITLTADVRPVNASNKKIVWKSSNTKIAAVNSKGVVTLKKKTGGRKVTITAAAADGSGVLGKYTITSMKNPVKKVTISGAKSVKAGKTLNLKAKVTASKGAYKKVIWTSSNKKYASVSSSGKVKTYKAGKGKKVRITAKAADGSGKKKTVTIKIK